MAPCYISNGSFGRRFVADYQLTLLFAGAVMTLQIADILIRYGAQGTVGGIMAIAMGRELGPVLVGVVLSGASVQRLRLRLVP